MGKPWALEAEPTSLQVPALPFAGCAVLGNCPLLYKPSSLRWRQKTT